MYREELEKREYGAMNLKYKLHATIKTANQSYLYINDWLAVLLYRIKNCCSIMIMYVYYLKSEH